MSTRSTLFSTPTVEIDQDRYEELVKREQKYLQYKKLADENIREIIEAEENFVEITEEEKENETNAKL